MNPSFDLGKANHHDPSEMFYYSSLVDWHVPSAPSHLSSEAADPLCVSQIVAPIEAYHPTTEDMTQAGIHCKSRKTGVALYPKSSSGSVKLSRTRSLDLSAPCQCVLIRIVIASVRVIRPTVQPHIHRARRIARRVHHTVISLH